METWFIRAIKSCSISLWSIIAWNILCIWSNAHRLLSGTFLVCLSGLIPEYQPSPGTLDLLPFYYTKHKSQNRVWKTRLCIFAAIPIKVPNSSLQISYVCSNTSSKDCEQREQKCTANPVLIHVVNRGPSRWDIFLIPPTKNKFLCCLCMPLMGSALAARASLV